VSKSAAISLMGDDTNESRQAWCCKLQLGVSKPARFAAVHKVLTLQSSDVPSVAARGISDASELESRAHVSSLPSHDTAIIDLTRRVAAQDRSIHRFQ
jgi:hypothetical protein